MNVTVFAKGADNV